MPMLNYQQKGKDKTRGGFVCFLNQPASSPSCHQSPFSLVYIQEGTCLALTSGGHSADPDIKDHLRSFLHKTTQLSTESLLLHMGNGDIEASIKENRTAQSQNAVLLALL